jgi:hypothetical protein
MAETIQIWVEISHHAAFRCGGWAFVLKGAEGLSGAAGGSRAITPDRAVLAGLGEALSGLPSGVAAIVQTSNAQIAALPARIAGFTTALKWVQIKPVANRPGTPAAFALAWAELARDKAKATGPFRSPIPKPNLAKAGA